MGDSTQSPAPSPPLADLAPPAPPAPAAASESEFFEAEDAAAEAPEAPAPPSPKRRGRPRKDDSDPPPPAPPAPPPSPAPKAAVRRQDKRTAPADARDTTTGRFTRPPSAKRSRTSATSVPSPSSYAPSALALARSESGRSTPGIERIFWEQRSETRDPHLTPPMLHNAMRAYLAEQRQSAEAQRRAGYVKLLRM